MTALLLIAVLPGQVTPRLSGPPHRVLHGAGMSALGLEVDCTPTDYEAARLLDWADRQNRVLLGYVAEHDVLPMALGALFSSPTKLKAHLAAERDALAARLASLSACSEYILQVRAAPSTSGPSLSGPSTSGPQQSGAAFLAAKQGRRQARAKRSTGRHAFLLELMQDLTQVSRAQVTRDVAGQPLLADISLLVERRSAPDLIAGLRARSKDSDALGLALRLIGPAPAYSFIADLPVEGETSNACSAA